MFKSRTPNYMKLRTNLKLCVNRLKLLEKKKTELALKARREISDYLQNGKDDRARIRVEHIIREDYMVETMEIIEMFCDLLLARFGLIQKMNELDPGLEEVIATLLWVAPRLVADCPELKEVSNQLTIKYGKEFMEMCRKNGFENVNEKVYHKLTMTSPPKILVEQYLVEIAKTYKVAFEPDPMAMMENDPTIADDLLDMNFNDTKKPGGGGMGGGGTLAPLPPMTGQATASAPMPGIPPFPEYQMEDHGSQYPGNPPMYSTSAEYAGPLPSKGGSLPTGRLPPPLPSHPPAAGATYYPPPPLPSRPPNAGSFGSSLPPPHIPSQPPNATSMGGTTVPPRPMPSHLPNDGGLGSGLPPGMMGNGPPANGGGSYPAMPSIPGQDMPDGGQPTTNVSEEDEINRANRESFNKYGGTIRVLPSYDDIVKKTTPTGPGSTSGQGSTPANMIDGLPDLPDVPSDSVRTDAGDDIDFDDLTKRFEELKKRK